MSEDKLQKMFEKHNDEYLEFDKIKNKLSKRADLHAFILLDQLVPDSDDILCGAGHDKVYLGVSESELAKVATKEQVIDLIRCGVCFYGEGLTMNV